MYYSFFLHPSIPPIHPSIRVIYQYCFDIFSVKKIFFNTGILLFLFFKTLFNNGNG